MIKIGDGIYYITCGEACFVMRAENDELDDVCFGSRVEFEDDVTALGVSGGAAFRADIVRAGASKNLVGALKLVSAEVVPASADWAFPLLRAEKTLKVVTATDGLEVELYFTPHTRGGISRRCAVTNIGTKALEVRSLGICGMTFPEDMTAIGGDGKQDVPMSRMQESNRRHVTALGRGCDEIRGEAIGIYPIYGGRYRVEIDGNRIELMLPLEKYALGAGERLESPEVLCVYSDRGTGGLARAYHDVIRDGLIPEKYSAARRPIAFYSAGKALDEPTDCVQSAGRIGADTYIASGDGNAEVLARLGAACADTGIKLGVSCCFESFEDDPTGNYLAPITDKMKGELGARILDMTSSEAHDYAIEKIEKLAAQGVRHLRWENARVTESTDAAYEFAYMAGAYKLLKAVAHKFPDIIMEGGIAVDIAQLAFMPYYGFVECKLAEKYKLFDILPPCAIGDYVVPPERVRSSFKTDFDAATTGSLSYIFDPMHTDENIARAIRAQIFSYQDDSALAVGGDLYRLCGELGKYCVALVSKDKARAYVVYDNESEEGGVSRIKLRGLDAHNLYHVRELGKTFSGAALAGYGVDVGAVKRGETAVFHLRQVVDYE